MKSHTDHVSEAKSFRRLERRDIIEVKKKRKRRVKQNLYSRHAHASTYTYQIQIARQVLNASQNSYVTSRAFLILMKSSVPTEIRYIVAHADILNSGQTRKMRDACGRFWDMQNSGWCWRKKEEAYSHPAVLFIFPSRTARAFVFYYDVFDIPPRSRQKYEMYAQQMQSSCWWRTRPYQWNTADLIVFAGGQHRKCMLLVVAFELGIGL